MSETVVFEAFAGAPKDFGRVIDRHTVVVGQSGSGKSYAIGRIVEELAQKLEARIIIFDRAGDFLRLNKANPELPKAEQQDDLFQLEVFRNRPRPQTDADGSAAPPEQLGVHLNWFSPLDLCAAFGFPHSPEYWAPLGQAQHDLPSLLRPSARPYDLAIFAHAFKTVMGTFPNVFTSGIPAAFQLWGAVDTINERLFTFARDLSEPGADAFIRDQSLKSLDVDLKPDTPTRVLDGTGVRVVDLSSLEGEHARSVLVLAVLRAAWIRAKEEWAEYRRTRERFQRTPTFIVIDEAHHLVPAEPPESEIESRVRSAILEIATEGRKFGLWLMCGTQRPTRLHPTIVTEASNFLLMRTPSPPDALFLAELLTTDGQAKDRHDNTVVLAKDIKDLKRGKGEAFLAGDWSDGSLERVQGSVRRTYHPKGGFPIRPRETFDE